MNGTIRKTPPKIRAKNKRHYMKMLAEGRCCSCGKADDRTRQGRARCAACNEKAHPKKPRVRKDEERERDNAEKREWARMRKEAHVCVDCGRADKETIGGKSRCLQCLKKRAYRQKQQWDSGHEKELRDARREKWIAEGLCSSCGHEKEEPDKKMCITCRVRAKLRKQKHKIKKGWLPRGANGKCFQCNRVMAIEGKRLCQGCYDKKIETLRIVAARKKKAGEKP